MHFKLHLSRSPSTGKPGLKFELTLEYENPHPGESMVVWMKKLKQFVSDEKRSTQELVLVDTRFQDLDDAHGEAWVDISSDIRYSEEAEAVVQAVITSSSGQTAGMVKGTAELGMCVVPLL